jgi:probable F420-dependent oxidoreductase
VQLAVLLAATERMVFGTGIANVWARQPQTAHGAAALLAQAFPGRFVLGLGAGYPQQAASVGREFGSPLATMRDYLDQMTAPTQLPAPDVAYPKIIGANGPKMLALSGEIADGAMPAMVPPEFTAQARQLLGPDKLLVVGLAVVADADPDRAKATARQRVAGRLGLPGTYAATLAQLGYSEREITEVSDQLVDAIVGYGDAAAIAAKVREHLAAGADHVLIMSTGNDVADGVDQLEQLAPTLVELKRASRRCGPAAGARGPPRERRCAQGRAQAGACAGGTGRCRCRRRPHRGASHADRSARRRRCHDALDGSPARTARARPLARRPGRGYRDPRLGGSRDQGAGLALLHRGALTPIRGRPVPARSRRAGGRVRRRCRAPAARQRSRRSHLGWKAPHLGCQPGLDRASPASA